MKLRFIGFLFYAESCKFFGTNSYQKGEEKTRPFIFFFLITKYTSWKCAVCSFGTVFPKIGVTG